MKKILLALLALVVILIALVLAHPLWIGPVVRTAVSQLAPKFLGVPAHLDGFSLNLYTGRVTVDGFALDNPPGCSEAKFVTVGHLCVDVDPMSVLSDPVVVEEISLKDLFVSLVTDEKSVYNFTTVSQACSSDRPKPSEAESKPKEKPADGKPSPKVVIDLIQVQTALVQWQRVPLPLPSFRLTGIGRGVGGVEFGDAWRETEKKFVGALGPLAAGLQTVLAGSQGSIDAGMKAASDVAQSVGDTKKALNDVGKALKDGTSASADAARSSVDAAAKSIKGGVDTLKSLFK